MFEVAGRVLALPSAVIRETIEPVAMTPVPRTPEFLLGLTNLRGQVLPVFDLSGLLGGKREVEQPNRWVVVERGNLRWAIPARNIATAFFEPGSLREHPDSAAYPVYDALTPTATGNVSVLNMDRLAATLSFELQFRQLGIG